MIKVIVSSCEPLHDHFSNCKECNWYRTRIDFLHSALFPRPIPLPIESFREGCGLLSVGNVWQEPLCANSRNYRKSLAHCNRHLDWSGFWMRHFPSHLWNFNLKNKFIVANFIINALNKFDSKTALYLYYDLNYFQVFHLTVIISTFVQVMACRLKCYLSVRSESDPAAFYPSTLWAGGVLSSRSGWMGRWLPDLWNPYLCNHIAGTLGYRNWPRYGLRCRGWYCHQAQHELCRPSRGRLRPRRPAQRVLCLMAVPPTTAQTV